MKLVVTDGATLSGGGVSLDIFSQFGEVQIYDLTAPEQLARCRRHSLQQNAHSGGIVRPLSEAAVCGRMCHRL